MQSFSNIFYPEPDALHVFSRSNSSFWLILFVKSEFIDSWKILYYLGGASILLFLGLVLHGRSVFMCWKYQILHPSFLALMTNFYVAFQCGSIARIGLIFYETRAVNWSDVGSTPIPFLGTIRQFGLAHGYCLLQLITTERVVATIFVADYEIRPRFYVPAFLAISADCILMGVSYAFVAGIMNGYFFCIMGVLPNFACAWILHHMLKRNEKRLARLSDSLRRYPNDNYSLSLRIQLKENIWSLQKIELGVVIIILVLVLNLSLFIAPVSILTHPDQRTALQWSLWAGNIVLAVSVAASAPMGTFAIALHTGERPFYVRWYLTKFRKTSVISSCEVKETETYFGQLHAQWDYAMKREKTMEL